MRCGREKKRETMWLVGLGPGHVGVDRALCERAQTYVGPLEFADRCRSRVSKREITLELSNKERRRDHAQSAEISSLLRVFRSVEHSSVKKSCTSPFPCRYWKKLAISWKHSGSLFACSVLSRLLNEHGGVSASCLVQKSGSVVSVFSLRSGDFPLGRQLCGFGSYHSNRIHSWQLTRRTKWCYYCSLLVVTRGTHVFLYPQFD